MCNLGAKRKIFLSFFTSNSLITKFLKIHKSYISIKHFTLFCTKISLKNRIWKRIKIKFGVLSKLSVTLPH